LSRIEKLMSVRVLQLISSKGYYGAENVVVNLARALEDSGSRAVVGAFRNSHSVHLEVIDRAQKQGLTVQTFECNGRFDYSVVDRISSFVAESGIDLVHTHGYKADLYGYFAARRAGKPIIATCHNWIGDSLAVRVYEAIDRFGLASFDAVVAVSEAIADRLVEDGVSPPKIVRIHNGIEVTSFVHAFPTLRRDLGWDERFIIGSVGRLSEEKGQDVLIHACSDLLRSNKDVVLVFVGDGPQKTWLKGLASRFGISSQVAFVGNRDDMPGVYASMDLFVLPSRAEGMPMVLLEAMASGLPVIASRVGAVPTVVHDCETGWTFEPENITELRSMLLSVKIGNARQSVGEAARRLVQTDFSSAGMASRYHDLYDRVLDSTHRLETKHCVTKVCG
jgi:glycosyltransferase involved in cell wall biosynthesis